MNKPETMRQKKVASLIQKDISEIFTRDAPQVVHGALVSVTSVRMSPDLALAKVYVSIFPFDKNEAMLKRLKEHVPTIRRILGGKVRNQLRIVPQIAFFVDDSLEYVERIEHLIQGGSSGDS